MEKSSQSLQLKKIITQSIISVITGAVFLLLSVGTNVWMSLETTTFLNQYRLGSKALTFAVQSYAATGDREHYDAYRKELNEDKNRDVARAGLEDNKITDEEWALLDQIAELSNGLVPLEEEALKLAEEGDTKAAMSYVFGKEYEDTTKSINDITDDAIRQIQGRVSKNKKGLRIFQIIIELLYITSFMFRIR